MSVSQAAFFVWLLALARIFGGAALLWALAAPGWAIAAWLLVHLRINLRPSGRVERH